MPDESQPADHQFTDKEIHAIRAILATLGVVESLPKGAKCRLLLESLGGNGISFKIEQIN